LFDAIVANPPFSAKWSADPLIDEAQRFTPYGKMAPSSKADYAFITHMLHHLHPTDGTLAVVLPHGALFRGAAEGHIRKHILDQNWLDAVIGLPANIFYGTSIPTCIMVFKKNRSYDDAVLFIDASNEFEKQKNQNYLKAEHIDKIVQTYRDREALDKYSYNATLDEIRENDYNLNIPRYVDTFEEEEPIDLKAVQAEIKEIDTELEKVEEELNGYLKELGL
jgi:type I restriction enzyme M protein